MESNINTNNISNPNNNQSLIPEIEKTQDDYDESEITINARGYVGTLDGSFWDDEDRYFNRFGFDIYGGRIDEYGNYIPGNQFNSEYGVYNQELEMQGTEKKQRLKGQIDQMNDDYGSMAHTMLNSEFPQYESNFDNMDYDDKYEENQKYWYNEMCKELNLTPDFIANPNVPQSPMQQQFPQSSEQFQQASPFQQQQVNNQNQQFSPDQQIKFGYQPNSNNSPQTCGDENMGNNNGF